MDRFQLVRSPPGREEEEKCQRYLQECIHSSIALNTEASTGHGDVVWAVRD